MVIFSSESGEAIGPETEITANTIAPLTSTIVCADAATNRLE
jgi:hypothetical protein